MRKFLAILCCRIVYRILNLVGHRGGTLPGRIALWIDPKILAHLDYPEQRIFITGTNGKTSVNNITSQILSKGGYKVVYNQFGDNLDWGITTTIINHAKLSGQVSGDLLCLEVDELAGAKLMDLIQPTHIAVNNFFRDQLDRVGEMDTLISIYEAKLKTFTGTLILNSNDPNVNRLALSAPGARILAYGVEANPQIVGDDTEVGEGTHCPVCDAPLDYTAHFYSHIGIYHCPHEDYGMLKQDLTATDVDLAGGTFKVGAISYPLMYPLTYSVFNQMAALTLARAFKVDSQAAIEVFTSFRVDNGRMESFVIHHGRTCVLNLAKNPTGAGEIIKFIQRVETEHVLLVVLNDNEADGTDVSWIWDTPYDHLVTPSTKAILCSGTRAYDMAIRFRYSDMALNALTVIEDKGEAVKALSGYDCDAYVLSNYTALQATRKELQKIEL